MIERLQVFAPAVLLIVAAAVALIEGIRLEVASIIGLSILSLLAAAVLGVEAWRRVRLRGDLVAWLDRVSAATGETQGEIASRAVSHYRARLGDNGEP